MGSFLRPAALMKMREAYAAGNAGAEELRATEDAAIRDLVATVKIVDKVDFGAHPFLGHFRFLNDLAGDALAKMTIPSPSMLHLICCVRATDYAPIPRYADEDTLFEDIALAYQKAIRAFYEAGCRYLQLNDTFWGEFCDPEKRAAYEARGFDLDRIERTYVAMINRALEAKPADMTITMHICRGNFRSTWFSSGGYEPVAEILFGGCHVDGFFLEYDSDRAGGFAPSTISRISTSFSDLSPQNRARSKRRRILSHASTRRQSTSRSISSASARSAASPRPRRETS